MGQIHNRKRLISLSQVTSRQSALLEERNQRKCTFTTWPRWQYQPSQLPFSCFGCFLPGRAGRSGRFQVLMAVPKPVMKAKTFYFTCLLYLGPVLDPCDPYFKTGTKISHCCVFSPSQFTTHQAAMLGQRAFICRTVALATPRLQLCFAKHLGERTGSGQFDVHRSKWREKQLTLPSSLHRKQENPNPRLHTAIFTNIKLFFHCSF